MQQEGKIDSGDCYENRVILILGLHSACNCYAQTTRRAAHGFGPVPPAHPLFVSTVIISEVINAMMPAIRCTTNVQSISLLSIDDACMGHRGAADEKQLVRMIFLARTPPP